MKKSCSILMIFFLMLVFVGCDKNKQAIKKDLNSRFTKFEIVEIKKDSANIEDASMLLMSLQLNISQSNLDMLKAENLYYDKKWSYAKASKFMDSITTKLMNMNVDFVHSQYLKSDPCYYVKYRIFKDELKVEKEEYYYFRIYNEGKQTEIMHRPCNWDEYLKVEESADLMDKCTEQYFSFLKGIAYKTY